jgi:hypothetical protein
MEGKSVVSGVGNIKIEGSGSYFTGDYLTPRPDLLFTVQTFRFRFLRCRYKF